MSDDLKSKDWIRAGDLRRMTSRLDGLRKFGQGL